MRIASLQRWRRAGLLTELELPAARPFVPRRQPRPRRDGPPSPWILEAYYAGHGDPEEAIRRRRADGVVQLPPHASAREIAIAVENALPVLAPVRIRRTTDALELQAGAQVTSLSRVVKHARVDRNIRHPVREPREIVRAINTMLARGMLRDRFVELQSPPSCQIFVAVNPRQARTLQLWGATAHDSTRSLWAFTGW